MTEFGVKVQKVRFKVRIFENYLQGLYFMLTFALSKMRQKFTA